jgi:hypothetical protein
MLEPPPITPPKASEPNRIPAWVWFIALLLLALVCVGEWYREVIALQQPPARPELVGGADGLRTLIWTDEVGIASSDKVRLWILCDNRTGGDVRNLRFLSFETPGFETGDCWGHGEPVCLPGGKVRSGLPPLLPNGHVASVYADMRPKLWYGRHGVSGLVAWSDAKGDYQRAVILPGLEVHTLVMDWLSSLAKAIEICALPVLVALAAWWFKDRGEKRDKLELAQRENREKMELEERDWNFRLHETWSQQLPKVMEYIPRYYMPVLGAMQKLMDTKQEPASEPERYQLLFRVMRLIALVTEMAEGTGGFFFKNLAAEDLATDCYNLFQDRSSAFFSEEDRARVLDVFSPGMSLPQFIDLARGGDSAELMDSFARLIDGLQEWTKAQTFGQDLVPIKIVSTILWYEINRPMELWYGELPEFPSESWHDAVDLLKGESQAKLRPGLEKYGNDCQNEATRSKALWSRRNAAARLLPT